MSGAARTREPKRDTHESPTTGRRTTSTQIELWKHFQKGAAVVPRSRRICVQRAAEARVAALVLVGITRSAGPNCGVAHRTRSAQLAVVSNCVVAAAQTHARKPVARGRMRMAGAREAGVARGIGAERAGRALGGRGTRDVAGGAGHASGHRGVGERAGSACSTSNDKDQPTAGNNTTYNSCRLNRSS